MIIKNIINENTINKNTINENIINENTIIKNTINENTIIKNTINENIINENTINENTTNENIINKNTINENIINENTINENIINENIINENIINENTINENIINENIINENIFLTFGNEKYYNSLNRIKIEASSFNIFNQILIYNDLDLKNNFSDFWEKHENFIINNKRGYGYWIWKSYLVLKTLEKMNENDILVYADAGCSLNNKGISRLNDYFKTVKNSNYGILSFNIGHLEKKYTKMDIFNELDMNTNEYLNSGQLMAGIFILKKCNHTLKLINEWYNFSCNYNLIDDTESNIKNDETFIENRHDQSIFSLIRKKYGTEIISDETWYPNWNLDTIKNIPILSKRII